ncbi:Tyrosine recombinase XerC [Methanimicrococcus stummii]|uniref:Tyrosine recombinase XerC n=1 Tax=Methanimicrococcus stummii TaxID=3028294 RepID=A0AA96V9E5_9EURY|nr:tyrosine-type recombinase/integrase [Methanimicrococcus sp. Es2]WNY28301.1 Tyrosine recombinase XerC [Methanimicrococcus sp. Es2]
MISSISETQPFYLNVDYFRNALETDTILRDREPRTASQYARISSDYISLTGTEQFVYDAEYLDFRPHLLRFLESLRKKNLSHNTIKFYFSALDSLFSFMKDEGFIKINPLDDTFRERYLTRYKPDEPPKFQQWKPEEIQLLIETAPNALWRAIIAMYAATGMRRGELIALNIKDVDFENRVLYLHDHKKRSNKAVIFSDWALSYLLDYLELRIE